MKNNVAFVLGNGRSRLRVNNNLLKKYGKVYGCNALYREFDPDYLVAVDVKMVNEIVESNYHVNNEVWTNPNKGIIKTNNLNFFSPHKGWSSGPTALWLASQHKHKNIYILGFDFKGVQGKFNNVYADTFNYKQSTDNPTYYGNWLNQTAKVISEFRYVKFYRVIEKGSFIPDTLNHLTNLFHITYDDFNKQFVDSAQL